MIHNHVEELRELFLNYSATIWSELKSDPSDRNLTEKIRIYGDRALTQVLEEMRNYQSPLKAIITLSDLGSLSRRNAYFGTYAVDASTRVSLLLTTADPTLREYMGGELLQFCNKNPNLLHGKSTSWEFEMIQSGGIVSAPVNLFSRIYFLWLREIN